MTELKKVTRRFTLKKAGYHCLTTTKNVTDRKESIALGKSIEKEEKTWGEVLYVIEKAALKHGYDLRSISLTITKKL